MIGAGARWGNDKRATSVSGRTNRSVLFIKPPRIVPGEEHVKE